jgi:hypothetical protein
MGTNIVDLSLPAVQLRQIQQVIERIRVLRDSQAGLVSNSESADIYQIGLYNGLEIAMSMLTNSNPTLCIIKCCSTCSYRDENLCHIGDTRIVTPNEYCEYWRQ